MAAKALISLNTVNFSCHFWILGPQNFGQSEILSLTLDFAERGEVIIEDLGGPSSLKKHGDACPWRMMRKTLVEAP